MFQTGNAAPVCSIDGSIYPMECSMDRLPGASLWIDSGNGLTASLGKGGIFLHGSARFDDRLAGGSNYAENFAPFEPLPHKIVVADPMLFF